MNKILVISLCALLLIAATAPTTATRYTSPIVEVNAGECYNFTHGLGARPMIVQAWQPPEGSTAWKLLTDGVQIYSTPSVIRFCTDFYTSVQVVGDL